LVVAYLHAGSSFQGEFISIPIAAGLNGFKN
jgi:hypothetical protein